MSLEWLKKKVKGFEAKKENSKVNEKIQKLIKDLKSNRESLASVQTGFPSSVASFVTNTWMPSDALPAKKKKNRWPSMKKNKGSQSKKAECNGSCEVRSPLDPQSVGRSEAEVFVVPQSVGQSSGNPQSVGEILAQICSDQESLGQFANDPKSVGQFGNDPQVLNQLGNDPEPVGQFGNDPDCVGHGPRTLGQLGNDPQILGQFGHDPQSVSQFCSHLQSEVMVLEQNSKYQVVKEVNSVEKLGISGPPVAERPSRLCPQCRGLLAIVLVLAVSICVFLDAKKAAVGVTAIVYFLVRVLFRNQESFTARRNILSIIPSICEVFSSLFRSLNLKTGLWKCKNRPRSKVLPSNGTCSNSMKEVCERIQCGKLPKTGMTKVPRRRKVQVQKSCLGKGISEECSSEKIGDKGLKLSSAMGSSVLIVVLVGLMAGLFPAFVLALAWCLLVKLVQIAEQGKDVGAQIGGFFFYKGKK